MGLVYKLPVVREKVAPSIPFTDGRSRLGFYTGQYNKSTEGTIPLSLPENLRGLAPATSSNITGTPAFSLSAPEEAVVFSKFRNDNSSLELVDIITMVEDLKKDPSMFRYLKGTGFTDTDVVVSYRPNLRENVDTVNFTYLFNNNITGECRTSKPPLSHVDMEVDTQEPGVQAVNVISAQEDVASIYHDSQPNLDENSDEEVEDSMNYKMVIGHIRNWHPETNPISHQPKRVLSSLGESYFNPPIIKEDYKLPLSPGITSALDLALDVAKGSINQNGKQMFTVPYPKGRYLPPYKKVMSRWYTPTTETSTKKSLRNPKFSEISAGLKAQSNISFPLCDVSHSESEFRHRLAAMSHLDWTLAPLRVCCKLRLHLMVKMNFYVCSNQWRYPHPP